MSKQFTLFTESRKNIVNHMPAAANANNTDTIIVRTEKVRAIANRHVKLDVSIKRGFAALYD